MSGSPTKVYAFCFFTRPPFISVGTIRSEFDTSISAQCARPAPSMPPALHLPHPFHNSLLSSRRAIDGQSRSARRNNLSDASRGHDRREKFHGEESTSDIRSPTFYDVIAPFCAPFHLHLGESSERGRHAMVERCSAPLGYLFDDANASLTSG